MQGEDQECSAPSQLIHNDYLSTLGLVVNAWLHCLCCESCETALLPSEVQFHMNQKHPSSGIKVDKARFTAALEDNGVYDDFPTFITDEEWPAFDGIKQQQGIRCLHCAKVTVSSRSMKVHHSSDHQGIPLPKEWPVCCVQRLSTRPGKARAYFQVKAPAEAQGSQMGQSIDAIWLHMDSVMHDSASPADKNPRQVSPWLLTTHWHEHFNGYDTGELLDLIALPKEGEFPGLRSLVEKYVERAIKLIAQTAELALQRLNSPDPVKE